MKYTVKQENTLLKFLYEAMAEQSRTSVKKYLEDGRVQVNGEVTKAFDQLLVPGDSVSIVPKGLAITRTVTVNAKDTAAAKGVRIVFEDDWLIVAEKAAGIPTIVQKQGGETAYSILTDYVRAKVGAERHHLKLYHKGPARVFILHRIDKGTSGLLVFAKDERVKELMQSKWNSFVLERKYVAILEGTPAEQSGTVSSWLTENEKSLKMSSSPYDDGGQYSVTHYKVLESGRKYCKAEFELETGRKNQIRVHCQDLGHPIAGDRKYGAETNPIRRLALHAATLVFRHPVTNEIKRFKSPLPEAFAKVRL